VLHNSLLQIEFERRREEFSRLAVERASDLGDYEGRFHLIAETSEADLEAKLGGRKDCGAFPSAEIRENPDLAVVFRERWSNHEEARRWALQVLADRTTFAADGSQLFFEREATLPIAAVQIGWFENPHRQDGVFEKQARFVLMSPDELLSSDEPAIPETRVSERRFREEVDAAIGFMRRQEGWQGRGDRMPLAFYDGTIFLSIAPERTQIQTEMMKKLVDLVGVSEETRVPIVGFVDRSFARDLMALADALGGSSRRRVRTIDDVSVLNNKRLAEWGDRTPYFYCRRRGLEAFFDESRRESIAGFVYLRTTAENPPARIDLPAWIYEDGLLDDVIDVVRAECVVGVGYPYPLEAADQTAVISSRDRESFLRALTAFAEQNALDIRISRKAASKGRRR